MHRRKLRLRGFRHKQVEALRLANERSPLASHLDDGLHRNLPGGTLEVTKLSRNLHEILNAAIVRHDRRPNLRCPESKLHKILHKLLVDDDELTRQHTTCLQVARERLKALVVAQDLRGRRSGHWSHEEAIAAPTCDRTHTKVCPVELRRLASHIMPEIALELPLGRGRPGERRKGTLLFRNVNAGILSRLVDVLKDLTIELASLLGRPRNAKLGKYVGKTLHTNPNRTMAGVRVAALGRRLKVDVNDLIQIVRENRSDLAEFLEVKSTVLHETRKTDGTQITDCRLIGRCVLNDLCTKITGFDRPEMLLIGLTVGCVLLQELRTSRLNLRVQNHLPDLLGRQGLATAILLLVLQIELLEF